MQMKNNQTETEHQLLSAEWARVGGGFSAEAAERPVDIERLLARSATHASADHRLFFVAATWLGHHHHLVDIRRLGRELARLEGIQSAAAGAMLSVANLLANSPRLEAAERHCRALAEPTALFDRIAADPVLSEYARREALPVFVEWGLWHDEISLKEGAIRPIRWILANCPELRARAIFGATLDGEIVGALRERARSVASLSRVTGASYAATHEATTRLSARGVVTKEDGPRIRLVLTPAVAEWFECYPSGASVRRRAADAA